VIAKVSVSPSVLGPVPPDASKAEKAFLKRNLQALAKSLVQHGCLVAADKDDAVALLQAAKELEQTAPGPSKAWLEALIMLKDCDRWYVTSPNRPPVSGATEVGSLRDNWKGAVRVVVVDQDQSEAMGIFDCDTRSQPEISPMMVARDSATFDRLSKLAEAGVWKASQSREDFWARVLRPLAQRSKCIEICDRFMLRGMVERAEGARQSEDDDALSWLLKRIDEDGFDGTTVAVYTSLGENVRIKGESIQAPGNPELVKELIDEYFQVGGGKIKMLEAHAVFWKKMKFADRPHDRHISFSCGADIGLERGLDSFDSESVEASSGIAWTYGHSQETKSKNAQERRAIESAS